MSEAHEVTDFDAFVISEQSRGVNIHRPRLRFHEETLRTPEEARADEMKALLTDPAYRINPAEEHKQGEETNG